MPKATSSQAGFALRSVPNILTIPGTMLSKGLAIPDIPRASIHISLRAFFAQSSPKPGLKIQLKMRCLFAPPCGAGTALGEQRSWFLCRTQ